MMRPPPRSSSSVVDEEAEERRPLLSSSLSQGSGRGGWSPGRRPLVLAAGLTLMLLAGSLAVWTAASHESQEASPATTSQATSAVRKNPPHTSSSSSSQQEEASSQHDPRPAEASSQHHHHHHSASSTVRSRSLFTCVLCVVAALVILVPRLACGPDDVHGGMAGPGQAEALVAREIRHGAALAVPWVGLAVPLAAIERSVVRGQFPYPLTLVTLQLGGTAVLGAFCSRRPPALEIVPKDDNDDDFARHVADESACWGAVSRRTVLATLGCVWAASLALTAEADRSCGPRLVAAFGSGQAIVVLLLVCAMQMLGDQRRADRDDDGGHRQQQPAVEEEEEEEASSGSTSVEETPPPPGHREDEEGQDDECGWCCCCLGASGVPGFAALTALLITFGGAAVMGLGEAEVGPVMGGCAGAALAGQVLAAVFFVSLSFRSNESVFHVLTATAGAGAALAAAAALVFEVAAPRLASGDDEWLERHRLRSRAHRDSFYWYLAADIGGTALLNTLSLAVLKRFSPVLLVLLYATASLFSVFVQSRLFGDVVTSLEYKGAMILVLGMAIWGLEVSKATLEKPTSTHDDPILDAATDDTLPPSNFLQPNLASDQPPNTTRQRNNADGHRRRRERTTPPHHHHHHHWAVAGYEQQDDDRDCRGGPSRLGGGGGLGLDDGPDDDDDLVRFDSSATATTASGRTLDELTITRLSRSGLSVSRALHPSQ